MEQGKAPAGSRFDYPPPIAKKLGFKLIAVELGQATIELYADPALHANPMVTIHVELFVTSPMYPLVLRMQLHWMPTKVSRHSICKTVFFARFGKRNFWPLPNLLI
ncbi:Uncharacterised protein [Legionella hackeliae]|nr:Uncharacterised protein [Legionella hackeliae]